MGNVNVAALSVRVADRMLFENLTFTASSGELVAIVGANGVGKTTLLRTIAGATKPEGGTVHIDGRDPFALDARRRAHAVTLIGSDNEMPLATSVREVVATGRFAYRAWWDWTRDETDDALVDAALRAVDLGDAGERAFDTLSSGERQRAYLALALAQDARVVLLDEPTSHLDPRYALETLCAIRGLATGDRTAFVVLHDLNEAAAVADRIAVLGEGRLLAYAAPSDALDPHILERAFGVAFDRFDGEGTVRVIPRGYRKAISQP